MKHLAAVLVAIIGVNAVHAEDQAPTATEEKKIDHAVKLTLLGGITFYSRVEETLKYQGTALTTTKQRSKTSPVIGAEVFYRPKPFPMSFGVIGEWNQFINTGPNDTELAVMAGVRGHKQLGRFDLWAGLSGGMMFLSLGSSSTNTGTYLVAATDASTTAFVFSPRIGFDYSLSEDFELGLQGAYHTYSGSFEIDATRISDSVRVRFTDDFSRSWWTTAARIGIRF